MDTEKQDKQTEATVADLDAAEGRYVAWYIDGYGVTENEKFVQKYCERTGREARPLQYAPSVPAEIEGLVSEVNACLDQAHADLDEEFADADNTGGRPDLQDSETMVPIYLLERITTALTAQQAENERLRSSGIAEIAAMNPNVMDYMRHWESRAEKAEAQLEAWKANEEGLAVALRVTRDDLLSALHSEFDGVWTQDAFDKESASADDALAAHAKLKGEA